MRRFVVKIREVPTISIDMLCRPHDVNATQKEGAARLVAAAEIPASAP
jgi:hypothetical protein